jgi:hypothetical protein
MGTLTSNRAQRPDSLSRNFTPADALGLEDGSEHSLQEAQSGNPLTNPFALDRTKV